MLHNDPKMCRRKLTDGTEHRATYLSFARGREEAVGGWGRAGFATAKQRRGRK